MNKKQLEKELEQKNAEIEELREEIEALTEAGKKAKELLDISLRMNGKERDRLWRIIEHLLDEIDQLEQD